MNTRIILSFKSFIVLILSYNFCFCQTKVVNDPGEGPKLISQMTLGSLLKSRFKDSIPGLDSMAFLIMVDKRGYAKHITYVDNYFAPKITQLNLTKIINYIRKNLHWKPAWVPTKNGIRFFDCEIYEEVDLKVNDKAMSIPNSINIDL